MKNLNRGMQLEWYPFSHLPPDFGRAPQEPGWRLRRHSYCVDIRKREGGWLLTINHEQVFSSADDHLFADAGDAKQAGYDLANTLVDNHAAIWVQRQKHKLVAPCPVCKVDQGLHTCSRECEMAAFDRFASSNLPPQIKPLG